MSSVTDCLVLCIDDLKTIKLFVFYDNYEKKFFIRGKNYDIVNNLDPDNDFCSELESNSNADSCLDVESDSSVLYKSFSFHCKTIKNVVTFLSYLISLNSCEFVLYNYNNLSSSSQNISYDFLIEEQDKRNEIVCYPKENFDKKMCLTMLNMLKNIFNEY